MVGTREKQKRAFQVALDGQKIPVGFGFDVRETLQNVQDLVRTHARRAQFRCQTLLLAGANVYVISGHTITGDIERALIIPIDPNGRPRGRQMLLEKTPLEGPQAYSTHLQRRGGPLWDEKYRRRLTLFGNSLALETLQDIARGEKPLEHFLADRRPVDRTQRVKFLGRFQSALQL